MGKVTTIKHHDIGWGQVVHYQCPRLSTDPDPDWFGVRGTISHVCIARELGEL